MPTNPKDRETVCPKRVWVLSTLADDEQTSIDGELPQGLRFHLKQCAPCREVADGLLAVANGLNALGAIEPDDSLDARAHERLSNALRAGAPLTGRVEIPDDPMFDAALEAYRPPWVRYARFSAAAAIIFLIGLVGVFRFATVETVPSGLTSGTGLQKNLVPGRDAAGAHESPEAVANRDSQPRRPAVQTEVCLHATYVEAAECDRPNVAHPAMPIPAARRGSGRTTTAPIPLPQEEIDKSRKVGSIVRPEDRP